MKRLAAGVLVALATGRAAQALAPVIQVARQDPQGTSSIDKAFTGTAGQVQSPVIGPSLGITHPVSSKVEVGFLHRTLRGIVAGLPMTMQMDGVSTMHFFTAKSSVGVGCLIACGQAHSGPTPLGLALVAEPQVVVYFLADGKVGLMLADEFVFTGKGFGSSFIFGMTIRGPDFLKSAGNSKSDED